MFWSDFEDFGLGSDPWFHSAVRGIRTLQSEVNRLFEDATGYGSRGFPAINVWSNPDETIVAAEVPGVDAQALDLNVMGNTLTISGLRNQTEVSEKEKFLRRERGFGSFTRTVELPYTADSEKVEATYKNGILKIVLPRAEADKPRKITVK